MITRSALGTLAVMMAGMIALGLLAPQPAQANDAGRAIAGLIAGTLVYELLGDDNPRHRQPRDRVSYRYEETKYRPRSQGWEYQQRRRGFWNGNRGRYDYRPTPPRPRYDRRHEYRHGYRDGYNFGYGRGRTSGYTGWSWGWGGFRY